MCGEQRVHLKAFLERGSERIPCSSFWGSFKTAGFDSGLREKLAGEVSPGVGWSSKGLQQREDWWVARCLQGSLRGSWSRGREELEVSSRGEALGS